MFYIKKRSDLDYPPLTLHCRPPLFLLSLRVLRLYTSASVFSRPSFFDVVARPTTCSLSRVFWPRGSICVWRDRSFAAALRRCWSLSCISTTTTAIEKCRGEMRFRRRRHEIVPLIFVVWGGNKIQGLSPLQEPFLHVVKCT